MIRRIDQVHVLPLLFAVAWSFLAAGALVADERPIVPKVTIDPATVVRSGPGYRYTQAGWIVVHIEGAPYERGYQHGQLLANELADFVQAMATFRSPKAPAEGWRDMRTMANTLFLRRYDQEYLLEMKGIADGAAAAGAKFKDRALDLVDIVTLNSIIEIEFLESGMDANPTGLEGLKFKEPPLPQPKVSAHPHCSAFVANGPATRGGQIVFGHITMFHLYCVRHYNVWLDIQPEKGHRVVMQTYPGGIMSGMDYYMNSAGLLVAETTIKQTGFKIEGWSLASRIRKAVQYSASIDEVVAVLKKDNNGLYSNEWLLADINTNEIAMFELGTHKSKLWRSSKDEWLAGTKGFYWGCNNTKDLDVRLETVASTVGKPANVVFHPQDRDMAWLKLFEKREGRIDEAFGFEAFTTPPLAAFSSCDAKFTTTAMAKELKTWALFGPPLGRTWDATPELQTKYPDIKPLVNNDWTLLDVNQELPKSAAPEKSPGIPLAMDLRSPKDQPKLEDKSHEILGKLPPAWHGTILPESDADIWLAAAFADYEKIVAMELAITARAKNGKLDQESEDRLALTAFAPLSRWLAATQRFGRDEPLSKIKFDWKNDAWYPIAAGKGVALLARMRDEMKTQQFLDCMDQFGRANAGKKVTTAQFRQHLEKSLGQSVGPWFDDWLTQQVRFAPKEGNFWSIDSFEAQPQEVVIVYGTAKDQHAQREAAELLQRHIARRWSNHTVPIQSDVEQRGVNLREKHLLLIGRPECNYVTQQFCEQSAVKFGGSSFAIPARNETYANPASAVIVAGRNKVNPRYSAVIFAGLSAEATRRCVEQLPARGTPVGDVILLPAGKPARHMALSTLVPVVKKEK